MTADDNLAGPHARRLATIFHGPFTGLGVLICAWSNHKRKHSIGNSDGSEVFLTTPPRHFYKITIRESAAQVRSFMQTKRVIAPQHKISHL